MDDKNDDYVVCENNWEKIREVEALGEHLNDVQRWFEADKEVLTKELEDINQAAASAGKLLHYLIAIQINLLENL